MLVFHLRTENSNVSGSGNRQVWQGRAEKRVSMSGHYARELQSTANVLSCLHRLAALTVSRVDRHLWPTSPDLG